MGGFCLFARRYVVAYPISNSTFLIGPEDADTACLLIHGFSGSPSEMRGLGDVLEVGLRSWRKCAVKQFAIFLP